MGEKNRHRHVLPIDTAGLMGDPSAPFEAFIFIPAMALLLTLIFALAPYTDPRARNLQRTRPLWLAVWIGSLAIVAVAQGVISLSATGAIEAGTSTMPKFIGSAVAIFIIVIGNLLSKARPNWFACIRTPWTLSSDRSWDITHRWAARLFMTAGVISLPALWLNAGQTGWIIMTVAISIAALVPVGLSYVIWRSDPHRETYSAGDN